MSFNAIYGQQPQSQTIIRTVIPYRMSYSVHITIKFMEELHWEKDALETFFICLLFSCYVVWESNDKKFGSEICFPHFLCKHTQD